MNKGFKIAIGSFIATAAVIKAVPALSEPVRPQTSIVVQTADLDLSTEAGREQLDHRLVNAARDACGGASDVDLAGKFLLAKLKRGRINCHRSRQGQFGHRRSQNVCSK